MDSELYESNCGRCIHSALTRAEGTICGLTGAKPALTGSCPDLVINPQVERDYLVRDRRRKIAEQAAADEDLVEDSGLLEMMADGQLRDEHGSIRWKAIIFSILLIILFVLDDFLKKH